MASEAKSAFSVKLSGMMRDGIVKRAMAAAFDKEKEALAKRETAIARRCYNSIYPASVRKLVDALPDGWTHTTGRPSFNVNGMHMEFHSADVLRVPYSSYRVGTIKDPVLVALIDKFQDDKKDYSERRKRAEVATDALVGSCTSTKQLREVWPQGVAFYKHIEPIAPTKLPAAQIQELNAMLGLKKAA